jgi:hypothetical protein
MGISIWQLLIVILLIVIFYGPVVHVFLSSRSHGGAKFGWVLATLFIPIFAYVVFLITTQNTVDQITNEHQSR